MTIEEINNFCQNTLISNLEITFTEIGTSHLVAQMPVSPKTCQPMGILHGGASLALAETVASAGSFLLADPTKFDVYGLQVTGNHIATASKGMVTAKAEIIHKGQTTHVWNVNISDDDGKLISTARVTNIVKEKVKK